MASTSALMLQSLAFDAVASPEAYVTKFWEYLFNKLIFTEEEWAVASQQPPPGLPNPSRGDQKRIDITVEYFNPQTTERLVYYMIVEAKRSDAGAGDIKDAENKGVAYANANLATTGRSSMWVMTVLGTSFRLWIYHHASDHLEAYYPNPPDSRQANKKQYLEYFGSDLDNVLRYIKQYDSPDQALAAAQVPAAEPYSTPGMSMAPPPAPTHGDEVDMLEPFSEPFPETSSQGDEDEMPGSLAPNDFPEAASKGKGQAKWVKVKITEKKHMTRPDEWLFKDDKGRIRSTNKKEWIKDTNQGKACWTYEGHRTSYYTYQVFR